VKQQPVAQQLSTDWGKARVRFSLDLSLWRGPVRLLTPVRLFATPSLQSEGEKSDTDTLCVLCVRFCSDLKIHSRSMQHPPILCGS